MNVNSINSVYSTKSIQSFKGIERTPQSNENETQSISKESLAGLQCLAAMLTPHKHFVDVQFGEKSFNLASGIATIDNEQKEVVSSLDIDMAQGKSKSDIIKTILKNATKIQDFTISLKDGSQISIQENKEEPKQFKTILTKDGNSEVIQRLGFGADVNMRQIDAYKKVIFLVMSSLDAEDVKGVTLSTLK